MLSEKILFALNNVDDAFLKDAAALLESPVAVRTAVRKRIVRVFLIAAVIATLMGATAYAIYRAAMYTRVPGKGTTEYHVLYQSDSEDTPKLLHVNFDRTKFALSFDVPSGGYFPVMRANDLPGEEKNWQKSSFYEMLKTAQYFGLPWEMKQVDPENLEIDPNREPLELLQEVSMDADTAKTWSTGYLYRDADRDVAGENIDIIRIDLYGGYKLHGQEVLLGAFSPEGVEVKAVEDGTIGEYQMVEVQMLQAGGAIDNHLFLFHPEKYYLLHISGNGTFYDFSQLERIGQSIEVAETGLYVDSYEDKVNFILADLAAG